MMENETTRPRFCGNILVRRSRRRSFINKTVFEGVFGVLSEDEFKYYRSSTDWTNLEKPQFSIQLVDIQAVEEVDDVAFSRPLCIQIIYTSHAKKEKSTRPVYLAAYEAEENISWITSIRSACLQNPVVLAYFHPGRFTGKTWICCSESKSHHGCKPCTIPGLPLIRRQKYKVSPAIEFFGFTVIANESFDSNLPGCLPFQEGDRLTVTEAAGKQEWKAFSASSTSEYGTIPCRSITIINIPQEPWYFDEIPSGLATALLREQDPGCFIVRRKSAGSIYMLSFRTEKAVKHVEITFDESSQKYRIKDESDSVSYVNFLQFDSIQQLLDQCKQHPTLGITLDKYPSIQTVDELWKIDWGDISTGEEIKSDLPWVVMEGKFRDQNALIHIQREGCLDSVKEGFTNHVRALMTLCHENIVAFYGMGSKGSRLFMVHSHYPKASLSDYLSRNASLLISHPSELLNIARQILTGMVYLEECSVVHGELVTSNCIIVDQGMVKISGFHCASSSWCSKPIQDQFYTNKIPIPEPEYDGGISSTKSDVWAYGLLVYTLITAGQKPIETLEQVLTIQNYENVMDHMQGFVEIMTTCLRTDPTIRPTFSELKQRCGSRKRISSTASASSYSLDLEDSFSTSNGTGFNGLEDSLNSEMATKEFSVCQSPETFEDLSGLKQSMSSSESTCWKTRSDKNNGIRFTSDDIMERLERAELEALKAKVLQRRAEAYKEEILKQVRDAERKCLKEVELITRTFICRINESNDRTSDSNQSRYIAEEAKRLAEEKFTLFKYESERTIHDIKTMLEETMLERDELSESLKSFGMSVDEDSKCDTPTRKDSLGELEKKYQRYLSTSDRTIQNMKSQLDVVVNQRDLLTEELNLAKNELRETRDLLEKVIKDKKDFGFRLDKSNCEVEKLEETISRMVHKRQKAERERDQLQILTDMSLMKLRQAEQPKKRHSVGNVVPTCEKKDPNLRKLSMQLMNLRTPTTKRRQSADTIYEVVEVSSSDEATFYSRNISDDKESPSLKTTLTRRRQREPDQTALEQSSLSELRCSTPKESDSEAELISSLDSISSSGYIMDMLSKEKEEKASSDKFGHVSQTKESENNQKNVAHLSHCTEQSNELFSKDPKDNDNFSNNDNKGFIDDGNYDNCQDSNGLIDDDSFDNGDVGNDIHLQLSTQTSLPFPIPTVLVDEDCGVENTTDQENEKTQNIPEIAISLVDDNGDFTVNGYFSEDETTNERVFIVPFDNSDTSIVYSFDSEGGAKKGVPQTIL